MNILHTLGLMKRSEHERIAERYAEHIAILQDEADLLAAKFKRAATDLAAQADEIAANKQDADRVQHMLEESEKMVSALTDKNVELVGRIQAADGKIAGLERCIASLKPDARLWRAARDKRAARKGVGK